jgi:hypothetical protein
MYISAVKVGALLNVWPIMAGNGGTYIKLIQRLTASPYLQATLQPRLGPDEVHIGQAASTTSQLHIMCSAVKVGALLNVWPIMAGNGGI